MGNSAKVQEILVLQKKTVRIVTSAKPLSLYHSLNSLCVVVDVSLGNGNMTGRRSKLPAVRPSMEGLSLWNLLRKNIGKDLSQVSMPVALNEPLNMLQVHPCAVFN